MDVSRIAGHEYATDTIAVDHPHVGAVEGHPGHALDADAPAGSCGDKASKAVFTDLWTRGARRERRRELKVRSARQRTECEHAALRERPEVPAVAVKAVDL